MNCLQPFLAKQAILKGYRIILVGKMELYRKFFSSVGDSVNGLPIVYKIYIPCTVRKNCLGGPAVVDEAQLARSIAAAAKLTASTRSRTTRDSGSKRSAVQPPTDPEQDTSNRETDRLELWRLLLQLKDLPEAWVKKLPLSVLFQLNSALAKERKTSEKLGVNTRLAHNAKKLARCPTEVESGPDNRKNLLHPARFL